jgi:hypothetical protein
MPRVRRRCSWITARGPCTRAGTGNPPVCDAHAEYEPDDDEFDDDISPIVKAATARIMEDPIAQQVLGKVGSILDVFGSILDGSYRWKPAAHAMGGEPTPSVPPPPRRPPPRPAPPPPPDPTIAARKVLGFKPTAILTRASIKARQRELARKYHPDRVRGDGERMKLINASADILLASVRQ